jgi:hypothetical protein
MSPSAVALIAAAPSTLAAVLVYVSARSALREASDRTVLELGYRLASLADDVKRISSIVDRIDTAFGEVRERLARFEGDAVRPRR